MGHENQMGHGAGSPLPTRGEWMAIGVAALVVTLLCILMAERRGLWVDEYITLRTSTLPWAKVAQERLNNGHSPLYFYYAKFFFMLGEGDRMLRLSSALAAGVALIAAALLALELGLRRQLVALLAIAACLPYWIEAGTLYRYMMPLIALTGWTVWLAARMTRGGHTQGLHAHDAVSLFVAVLLMVCTHASVYFVLAPLAGWLAWEGWRSAKSDPVRLRLRAMLLRVAPVAAAVALGVPLLARLMPSSGRVLDEESFDAAHFQHGFVQAFFGDLDLWPRMLERAPAPYFWFLTALLLLAAAQAWRELRWGGHARAARLLAVLLIGMPLSVAAFQMTGRYFDLEARYVGFYSVPCLLAAAVVLEAAARGLHTAMASGWRTAGPIACAALLALAIVVQAAAAALSPGDHHRAALHWVAQNVKEDVAFYPILRIFTMHGLHRMGWQGRDLGGLPQHERSPKKVTAYLLEKLGDQRKGVIVLYCTRLPGGRILRQMYERGEIAAFRDWELYDQVEILAFARTQEEIAWLRALPEPLLEMGHADERSGRGLD
jgi:uncharacterized membrane protein